LSYLSGLANGKPADYWKASGPLAASGFVVTLGLRQLLRRLAHLPPRRQAALAAPAVLLASGVVGAVHAFAFVDWCGEGCRPHTTLGYAAFAVSTIYVVTTWAGLYVGIKAHQKLREQTEAVLAATAAAHLAQLRMLRYQLNPHFLFNTLNAITTLNLEGDTAAANRVVDGLAAFLRHSLDNDPMQQVTVTEEVEALHLYLAIEQIRFADRLRVETEIAPECRHARLPSLLLQPLVENAIKHAVAKKVEGGSLRIAARRDGDRLQMTVADDGPGGLPPGPDTAPERGVGLSNTRARLRVLYGARQSLEVRRRPGGGFEVHLSLPFDAGERRA
jgi:LytS/YehU family sensor histidine kinase